MQIYRNLKEIPFLRERAITVGTYDGVHIGHQSIINYLRNLSLANKTKSMLVTFEPHPQIFFNTYSNSNPKIKLLTTLEERLIIFEKLGIDEVFVVPFDSDFANISAEDFVKKYLYEKIGFSIFLVGFNHNFGRNRAGSFELIQQLNFQDITLIRCEPVFENGIEVSSTKIRNSIIRNELEAARVMLGRSYSITGKVVSGRKIGRKIGFPTANISTNNIHKLYPPNGVYSCEIYLTTKYFFGLANIGKRPTFEENDSENILEVHIFDFDADIYGLELEISFKKFLREEKKFNSIAGLIEQINKDKIAANK